MEFSKCLMFLLIVLSIYYTTAQKLPCNSNTANEVDRILAKVNPIGNPKVDFPETIAEAKKNCKQLLKPLNTLDDLNKRCMKGMMKEVVGIVLYSVKKKRRAMCRKNTTPELRELVDSGKCVNKGRFELEKCANKSLDRFMAMKEVENDMKIPLVCCEIAGAKKCMLDSLDKIDLCTNKHEQTLEGHFNGLSGGALKIACSEYKDGSERCNKLKSFKLQVKPGKPRPKSLVLPVIELFDSLDSSDNKNNGK